MATYDSIHTGTAVDQAVAQTLLNKSIGDSSTPIKLDSNGQAVAVTKSTTPTENDNKLITSGAMYTALDGKYNKADVATNPDLGTSTTLAPSQKAVKTYTDKVFSAIQPTVVGGSGITKTGNELSVNTTGLMNPDELTGKREHYGEYVVGYDSDVLSKVEAAKHSSFDSSKFTKVGSPIVTKDGIASGFSDSNYITAINLNLYQLNSFKICIPFTTSSTFSQGQRLYDRSIGSVDFVNFEIKTDKTCNSTIYANNTVVTLTASTNNALENNTSYLATIEFTNYQYVVKCINSTTKAEVYVATSGTTTNNIRNLSVSYYIGRGYNSNNYFTGSIDLKQFSITVDGVEVFSGNKTGIDTIKPSNFTAVTSSADSPFVNPSLPFSDNGLTISADGIASGFSASNYFTQSLDFRNANSWQVNIGFKTPASISSTNRILQRSQNYSNYIGIGITTSGFLSFMTIAGNNYAASTVSFQANTNYEFIFAYNNSTYTIKYKKDGDVGYTTILTRTSSAVWDVSALHYIGNGSNTSEYFRGSIDLNAFKIYVDGDLVYQPCLKIPYTLSKDGKKIVDEYYRSRVEDEVIQATFTPYYTLQSENKGNYAVVGSPTISSDWVASGFSSSNYLTKSGLPSFSKNNSFKVIGSFKTGSVLSSGTVWARGGYTCLLKYTDTGHLDFNVNTGTYSYRVQNVLTTNTEYDYECIYDGESKIGTLKYKIKGNANWNTYTKDFSSSPDFTHSQEFTFGYSQGGSDNLGSIDLKQFKIYVDGNLAYQAVIPPNYTMATNKPQDIIETYQNGANKYIQRANLQLEEYGTCTGTTAVTFQKPFRDDNYALTVPYSTKSKTGFTPDLDSGVTRDWKAKGFYSL